MKKISICILAIAVLLGWTHNVLAQNEGKTRITCDNSLINCNITRKTCGNGDTICAKTRETCDDTLKCIFTRKTCGNGDTICAKTRITCEGSPMCKRPYNTSKTCVPVPKCK